MSLAQFLEPQLEPLYPIELDAQPRVPILLVVDSSKGLSDEVVRELNKGLAWFHEALLGESLLADRVEVALVSYGPTQLRVSFQKPAAFVPPYLEPSGEPCLGEAVSLGLELLTLRGRELHEQGVPFARPLALLLSSEAPADEWRFAAWQVREGEGSRALSFFAVDIANSDIQVLQEVSVREPLQLRDLRVKDLFKWLVDSLTRVSLSTPEQPIPLENPCGPGGWATVL